MTKVSIPDSLIDFGEFQDKLSFEVRSWLDLNCQEIWRFTRQDDSFFIELNSDDDATLFKLIWL